jgi:hypothetical protein
MAFSGTSNPPLRQILEQRLSQLSSEMENLVVEARERARGELAEQLNIAVRRFRLAPDPEELCATLVDAAGGFAGGAALFRVDGQAAKGERIRGVPEQAAETFRGLSIPLSAAAALAGAVESRDPVIAAATAGQVSEEMASLAGHAPDARVSIFPLVMHDRVPALLYTWGTVQGALLELLTQVAASAWAALPVPAPPDLVTITPAEERQPAPTWEQLPAEEQQIHLRAQRSARVAVAEMRLFETEAVQAGRTRRDLYDALRKQIDAARTSFHAAFFAKCPSMVDYIHLELVRTLANDDPELLGKDYPGPLV